MPFSPLAASGAYHAYLTQAPEPDAMTDPADAGRSSALERINAAWVRFRSGKVSYAETLAAYRAAGLAEEEARLTLAVAIASHQPGARKVWWRRRRSERQPPVWR